MGDELIDVPRSSKILLRGRYVDYPLRPRNALAALGPGDGRCASLADWAVEQVRGPRRRAARTSRSRTGWCAASAARSSRSTSRSTARRSGGCPATASASAGWRGGSRGSRSAGRIRDAFTREHRAQRRQPRRPLRLPAPGHRPHRRALRRGARAARARSLCGARVTRRAPRGRPRARGRSPRPPPASARFAAGAVDLDDPAAGARAAARPAAAARGAAGRRRARLPRPAAGRRRRRPPLRHRPDLDLPAGPLDPLRPHPRAEELVAGDGARRSARSSWPSTSASAATRSGRPSDERARASSPSPGSSGSATSSAGEVIGTRIVRVPAAYPLFEVGYERHAAAVRDGPAPASATCFVAGRSGCFAYQNMDHAIRSGIDAARALLAARRGAVKCALVIPAWSPAEIFPSRTAASQINYWQPLGHPLRRGQPARRPATRCAFSTAPSGGARRSSRELAAFAPRLVGLYATAFGWHKARRGGRGRPRGSCPAPSSSPAAPTRCCAGAQCLREAPELDAVVTGEGEDTMVELAARLERGEALDGLAGIAFRRGGEIVENPPRPLILDLDRLPVPGARPARRPRGLRPARRPPTGARRSR